MISVGGELAEDPLGQNTRTVAVAQGTSSLDHVLATGLEPIPLQVLANDIRERGGIEAAPLEEADNLSLAGRISPRNGDSHDSPLMIGCAALCRKLRSPAIVQAPITLVTGAEGFVGGWLLRHLAERNWPVIATRHPDQPSREHGTTPDGIRWVEIDLTVQREVRSLLQETAPRYIVHLAAIALPSQAAANPLEALRVNYGVVDGLLAAMTDCSQEVRVLLIGTGEAYGSRPEGSPALSEDEPLRPPSPYSATKTAAEVRGLYACACEGLDVIVARPLNHSGPGRPPSSVMSAAPSPRGLPEWTAPARSDCDMAGES